MGCCVCRARRIRHICPSDQRSPFPFHVQENVMHGDYIQYSNLIAITRPLKNQKATSRIPAPARKPAASAACSACIGSWFVSRAPITKKASHRLRLKTSLLPLISGLFVRIMNLRSQNLQNKRKTPLKYRNQHHS